MGAGRRACRSRPPLGTARSRSGDTIAVSLPLAAPPTAAGAIACSNAPGVVTGGIWSAEFWAASDGNPEGYGESYYIGYRDNTLDVAPVGEAGRVDNVNPTITSLEYHRTQAAAVSGSCVGAAPPRPRPPPPPPSGRAGPGAIPARA